MTTLSSQLRTIKAGLGRPGLSTQRALSWDDVRTSIRALPQAKRRLRRYSGDGFVPNSYRWGCQIQFIEWTRDEGGRWVPRLGWTLAQRSGARGSLTVVQ